MLVAIEGIDGVGKTTLVSALRDRLVSCDVNVAIKPEFPDGTLHALFSNTLSNGLFLAEHLKVPKAAAFFHLLYAEALSLGEVTETADVILADRHLPTHAMYQAYFAAGCPPSFSAVPVLKALDALFRIVQLPTPDAVLLLDATVDEVIPRLEARERRKVTESERSTLEVFRREYKALAVTATWPTYTLDAMRPLSELIEEASSRVTRLSRRRSETKRS